MRYCKLPQDRGGDYAQPSQPISVIMMMSSLLDRPGKVDFTFIDDHPLRSFPEITEMCDLQT
jgi:hypothetical protein